MCYKINELFNSHGGLIMPKFLVSIIIAISLMTGNVRAGDGVDMALKITSAVMSGYGVLRSCLKTDKLIFTEDIKPGDKEGFFRYIFGGRFCGCNDGCCECGCTRCCNGSEVFRFTQRVIFWPALSFLSVALSMWGIVDSEAAALPKVIWPIVLFGVQALHDVGFYGIVKKLDWWLSCGNREIVPVGDVAYGMLGV